MRNALLAGVIWSLAASSIHTQNPGDPPHRRHHALTYDSRTKRVILFGGQQLISDSNTPVLDDLWSWDGQRWVQVRTSTGIGMIGHKLFADSAGNVFASGTARAAGSFGAAASTAVTVRWDGARWLTVVGDSTPYRESAAGAYDSARERYVLFGGLVGMRLAGTTWEFDGTRWDRVATSGPPPTLGGAMAYDRERRVVVLFGGVDSVGKKYGDTWTWNGQEWTRVASTGPSPRFGAGMANDAARHEVVLFGGVDSSNVKLNDTWRWDGRRWRLETPSVAPPPRSEGYMAYDEARRVVVMFGGEGVKVVPTLGDTWEWDGSMWKRAR